MNTKSLPGGGRGNGCLQQVPPMSEERQGACTAADTSQDRYQSQRDRCAPTGKDPADSLAVEVSLPVITPAEMH